MPKPRLKQITTGLKSSVAQATGSLDSFLGAGGTGAFGVSSGENGVSISGNFNQLINNKKIESRTTSDLRELYADSDSSIKEAIVFPSDLDDEHYIIFNAQQREREARNANVVIQTYQSIVLPVPSNLQVAYNAQYEDSSLGLLGGMAAGDISGGDLGQASSDIASGISNFLEGLKGSLSSSDTQTQTDALTKLTGQASPALAAILGAAGAGAIGGLLGGGAVAGDALAGSQINFGRALNPHLAVLFKGVGFRQHEFSYRFVARNQQESQTIKKVIRTFQKHMHPELDAGSLLFKFPDEFSIEFADSIKGNLYQIGTCVLESFNVNYNGEGTPLFFENTGAPVVVDITMSFKETKIITRENFLDVEESGEGVA